MMTQWEAWVQMEDGSRREWKGLRKAQARWRYNWIRRRTAWGSEFYHAKQWGWREQYDVS